MNSKLRRRLSGTETARRIRCRFDLDTRFYGNRLALCFGLAVFSLALALFADLPVPVTALLAAALPITGFVAWQSYRRLQMRQPVIAVGRRGIWDRRLGSSVIPWTDIVRVRTDGSGNVILDPWKEFNGIEQPERSQRLQRFMRFLDPSLKPGSLRIRLADVEAESWDLLAAIEASLPYYLRSLWRPEPTRRGGFKSGRAALVGMGAAVAALALFVATPMTRSDSESVLHSMGPATDFGIVPGHGDSHRLDLYKQAAEDGDTDARMRLGLMFYEGDEIPKDHDQAAHWFRLAAAADLPAGEAALGYLHEQGLGVGQDFAQALSWYRKAAKDNHAWAQYRLGLMYRDGRGVSRDPVRAATFLSAAAEQGDMAGQFHLGEMYENGWGVPQDPTVAATWYRKAAEQSHQRAEYNLASLFRDGRGVPRDPEQAALWFERSAARGFALSQYALGLAYEVGQGVARDPNRSLLWYYLAERHGHREAANRRKQLVSGMTAGARKRALRFRQEWLQRNLLRGEASEKFATYRKKPGPKAFTIAMNGAWAQTERAAHARDAVHHSMRRCREYASVCILYAVGEEIVVGLPANRVDAVIARQLKKSGPR